MLKRRLKMWGLSAAMASILFLIGVTAIQRKLIYHPLKSAGLRADSVTSRTLVLSDVETHTADQLTLRGWHLRPAADRTDSNPVVVFFPGNAANRRYRLEECEMLAEAGCDVLLFDYRGYGDNPGAPDESGLAADARAAWQFATGELSRESGQILLYGESLGGAVAIRLAHELCQSGTPPAGLIVRSTFTSLVDAGRYHFPWLPVRLVLLDRFQSLSRIGEVHCPILITHGDQDSIVPFWMGQELANAAPERSQSGQPQRFVTLPGADHNDVLSIARATLQNAVVQFVQDVTNRDDATR